MGNAIASAYTTEIRTCFSFSLALLVAGCGAIPDRPAAERPRLVVFFVVDGLPQRQVVDYREQLARDGFRRFLDRGAWFSQAHYGHAHTVTAAGHATMLTGAYPHRTGIIGNEWRDPATGQWLYNTADASAKYLGHEKSSWTGTSPRNLRVETVGDVLRTLDARSKVVSISAKDRGAILTGGHKGVAYVYQLQTGLMASTTYYMAEHPAWVTAFNATQPANAYFHKAWAPLLAEKDYAPSLPDEQKWFARGGKLPKRLGDALEQPGPLFYAELAVVPQGDQLLLDFARAAIIGEGLGQDDAPDILAISLSTHDNVNHGYGAESRISHDHLLHLDRSLERFFRDLDAAIGSDRYVAVLTSDHGFMATPEYLQMQGREGGRVSTPRLIAALNTALAARFGEGRWALGTSAQAVLLNRALIEERKADAAELARETRRFLLEQPFVAAAYTRAEIESASAAGAPYFEEVRRGWHPGRSADVQIVLKPNWMFGAAGATHGSPHDYDTRVPLLFYGPRWVTPARHDARVEIVDIAPTLARILQIPAPSSSEGKPLPVTVP